ncbi:MAG: DUF1565 domain-containing protein [Bacteroidales bacterium]|nr:DUF1565 domain-containing protein [Bacteroidales bacterium]
MATNYVQSTGIPTDGNGIILDDFHCSQSWDIGQTGGVNYPHASLIENNLCYNNGGRGIHIFNSDNATIRNNTCYYNNYILDQYGHYSADLQVEGAGCSLYNNIAIQKPSLSTRSRAIKIYNQTPPCERNIFAVPLKELLVQII